MCFLFHWKNHIVRSPRQTESVCLRSPRHEGEEQASEGAANAVLRTAEASVAGHPEWWAAEEVFFAWRLVTIRLPETIAMLVAFLHICGNMSKGPCFNFIDGVSSALFVFSFEFVSCRCVVLPRCTLASRKNRFRRPSARMPPWKRRKLPHLRRSGLVCNFVLGNAWMLQFCFCHSLRFLGDSVLDFDLPNAMAFTIYFQDKPRKETMQGTRNTQN